MDIPTFSINEDSTEIIGSLQESGCVVVTDITNEDSRNKVKEELAPYMAISPIDEDDPRQFYPGKTRRMSALIAFSETIGNLAMDPMSTQICDHFLLPNAQFGYQLHVSAALEVGPGARKQILHREEDPFLYFPLPRPNLIVASMWSITDFRDNNGATLLVPGSHKWDKDRTAEEKEVCSAEMPAGSVLYWLGGTLHGAGANTSSDWRYGIILTYSLGWLRQEENQFLDVPPEVAKKLPSKLAQLIGYRTYDSLGFSVNPEYLLEQDS